MSKCVFENGNTCEALHTRNCEKCTFRKTRQELIEGRKRAWELLEKLPTARLERIEKKYYRSKIFENIW